MKVVVNYYFESNCFSFTEKIEDMSNFCLSKAWIVVCLEEMKEMQFL